MNDWEKFKILSNSLGFIIIPIVIVIVGNKYSNAIKEREIQGKFVELSVQILQEQPVEERSNIRDWAIKVINKYSGVTLDSLTMNEIKEVPITITLSPYGTNLKKIISKERKDFFEKKLKHYNQEIKKDSTNHELFNFKGDALYRLGKYKKAEKALRKSIYLDNKYILGHHNLALVLWDLGKEKEAIKEIKIILRINPDYKKEIKRDIDFNKFNKSKSFRKLMN